MCGYIRDQGSSGAPWKRCSLEHFSLNCQELWEEKSTMLAILPPNSSSWNFAQPVGRNSSNPCGDRSHIHTLGSILMSSICNSDPAVHSFCSGGGQGPHRKTPRRQSVPQLQISALPLKGFEVLSHMQPVFPKLHSSLHFLHRHLRVTWAIAIEWPSSCSFVSLKSILKEQF